MTWQPGLGKRFRGSMKVQTNPQRVVSSPPRGVVNDGNFAHLYSLNILYDPGVELFVGNAVGSYWVEDWDDRTGMRHYTLPVYDPSCEYNQKWPNGDCVDYYDIAQWVSIGPDAATGKQNDSAWHVGRFYPYLGDYHMVWHDWQRGPGNNPATLMVQSPGLPAGYSARVIGGDFLGFSVRCRTWGDAHNDFDQVGDPTISILLWFYNQSGTLLVGSGNYYNTLSGTYAEFRHDAVAPNNSYFVRAMVAFTAQTPSEFTSTTQPATMVDSGIMSIE